MTKENLKCLEEWYNEYRIECKAALRTALAKIDNVKEMVEQQTDRSPIDAIYHRTKKFESVLEKCNRKGYDLTPESIENNIQDIAGIRIITPFRDDITIVADILRSVPGLNIKDEKDYVANPKPNGYASYHMHLLIEVYNPIKGGTRLVSIEVQIRDKSMDLWASIEHIIKYKNPDPPPEVEVLFKNAADSLAEFAETAIQMRDFSSCENQILNNNK